MLYASVATLCLVWVLLSFEHVQCRSTGQVNEYSGRSSPTRRCLQSCFLISRHQTCYEKCLGRNKEGDFNLSARIMGIPPHLSPSLKRRKRNANEDEIACPDPAIGNNSFPTLRTTERNQYGNSDKWYLNISWHPISDSTNFTGYGISYWCDDGGGSFGEGTFAWLGLQKNETSVIFNESESCWNYNMTLRFRVIVLPCLDGRIDLEDLPWNIATTTDPVPTTNKVFSTEDDMGCPDTAIGNNSFPTLRKPERNQYEISDKWYLNISWYPITDSTNFTGYGISYWCDDGEGFVGRGTFGSLGLQKTETYVIFNESESCWSYDMVFRFRVIVLPCLDGVIDLEDLPWNIATTTDPVPTTNKGLSTVVPLTVIAITVVLVSVILATYLCLRKRKRRSHNVPTDDADYDAFIIFNQHDQKWVDEVLLQILEKESHYKCCVHYRDFTIGKDFVTNMTDSVQNSRKVIAVISKTFFSSKWCNFELQQAIYKHIKKGDDGVIVIKIDNVSREKFPKAIQTKSFIDYSNRVERPFFKTRLLRVLESNSSDEHIIPMQIDG